MPRQRSSARPSTGAPPHRSTHTAAAPQHTYVHHVPAQQQRGAGQGLFGQMASTAAGVAVGSTVGHGLGNMLFGSHGAPYAAEGAQEAPSAPAPAPAAACATNAKEFTQCLDATGNDMGACQFYLDQLKACQAAAAPY